MKRKDTTEKSPRKKLPPKRIWVNWFPDFEQGKWDWDLGAVSRKKAPGRIQYRLVEPRRKGKR